MSRNFFSVSQSRALGVSIALTVVGAAANADELAEVVVTAQKREQRLVDIAAPVSVLSGEEVARRGVSDFEGLVEQIPGISITSDFGGGASKVVAVRGVGGTDDYRPNGSPSVGFHVDNVYQVSNVFLLAPFFDVERVEVLKGPQGTLYGRNSTAGVVNLITRGPTKEFAGSAVAEVGAFDRQRLEGSVSGSLSSTVSVRFSGLVDQGGGYMDGKGAGSFAGRVFIPRTPAVNDPGARDGWGDRDLIAGRLTVAAELGAESRLTFKAFASEDEGENLLADSEGGVSNVTWLEPDNDPYTFYSNRYPTRDIAISGASLSYTGTWADDLSLDVIAGFQQADRTWSGGGGTPRRNFDYDFTDDVSQSSIEARVSNSADERFKWVVGLYGVQDDVNFVTRLLSADVRGTDGLSNYTQERQSVAAFGQMDWRFAERFILSAGLRFTADDGKYFGSTIDLNPWGVTQYPAAFPELPVRFNEAASDDNISGRATLAYEVSEALRVYGSVGTGYKAGGFDGSTIFSAAEAKAFKPETVLAYEAGLKYSGPRGLFLGIDGFYYDFKELQAFTVIPLPGGGTSPNLRTNVGRSEFRGVDVLFGVNLVDGDVHTLRFDLGGTWLSSEILEFSGTPAQVAQNLGNDLPAAPRFSGNASLVYTLRPGTGWRFISTLDARKKSSEFKRLNNNVLSAVEGYRLLNLRAELAKENGGWGIFIYGRNMTDEVYFLDRNGGSRLVGAPKTYGVGLTLSF